LSTAIESRWFCELVAAKILKSTHSKSKPKLVHLYIFPEGLSAKLISKPANLFPVDIATNCRSIMSPEKKQKKNGNCKNAGMKRESKARSEGNYFDKFY